MLTKSPAARTAIVYVTIGALTLIWTVVWYWWMIDHPPEGRGPYYFVVGFLATGVALLLIGFGVGRLGYSARHADNAAVVVTPPTSTTAVIGPPEEGVLNPAVAPPAPPAEVPQATAPPPVVTTSAGNRYHRPSSTPMNPQRT